MIFCLLFTTTLGTGLLLYWPVDPVERVIRASKACLASIENGLPLQVYGFELATKAQADKIMGDVAKLTGGEIKAFGLHNPIYRKTPDDRLVLVEDVRRNKKAGINGEAQVNTWRFCTLETRISGFTAQQFEEIVSRFAGMKDVLVTQGTYSQIGFTLWVDESDVFDGFQSVSPNKRKCIVSAYLLARHEIDSLTIKYGEQSRPAECGALTGA
jgi:hypothetical protein